MHHTVYEDLPRVARRARWYRRAMARFRAELMPVHGGGHYVVVPVEVADEAGLAYRARVRGTVDGAPYRSALMKYGGEFHMGVKKVVLEAAGVGVGDVVAVVIERDPDPLPTDTVPPELARAIRASKAAAAAWAKTSPAHRREHVRYVIEAVKAETRARRIAKTVDALASGAAARAAAEKRAWTPAKKAAAKRAPATKAAAKKAPASRPRTPAKPSPRRR